VPNGAPAQAPVPYGVMQTPIARESVTNLAAAHRLTVMETILKLQDNPRPDGYESADTYGKGLTSITITNPPYIIVYSVDDDDHRVIIMAITEKRW
jgi:mRNA-degrading endonuclease RelE of RelBE toxin-antitoxin system